MSNLRFVCALRHCEPDDQMTGLTKAGSAHAQWVAGHVAAMVASPALIFCAPKPCALKTAGFFEQLCVNSSGVQSLSHLSGEGFDKSSTLLEHFVHADFQSLIMVVNFQAPLEIIKAFAFDRRIKLQEPFLSRRGPMRFGHGFVLDLQEKSLVELPFA